MQDRVLIGLKDNSESIKTIVPLYESTAQDIRKIILELHSKITEVCNDAQIKTFVDSFNLYIDNINNTLKNDAVKAFDAWAGGDASFSAYTLKSRAGSSAVATAKNVESSLKNSLLKVFTPELESIKVDLSKPELRESHYKKLDDAFNRALKALNSEQEKIERKINSISSKDSTVHCAKAAAKVLTEYVINALKHATESIKKNKEQSLSIAKSNEDNANQALAAVKHTATSAEALSRILAKLEAADEDLE